MKAQCGISPALLHFLGLLLRIGSSYPPGEVLCTQGQLKMASIVSWAYSLAWAIEARSDLKIRMDPSIDPDGSCRSRFSTDQRLPFKVRCRCDLVFQWLRWYFYRYAFVAHVLPAIMNQC